MLHLFCTKKVKRNDLFFELSGQNLQILESKMSKIQMCIIIIIITAKSNEFKNITQVF